MFRSNQTTFLSTSWPDLFRPSTPLPRRKAVETWMPPKSDVSDLGQIFAEVGNTRLRTTSAGMTAESVT